MQATASAPRKRFSADEVVSMVEHGLLDGERVELVGGEMVQMSPKGSRHVVITSRVASRLADALGGRAWVAQEPTLRCGPSDLREPDVAVLRGQADDYLDAFPSGQHALLVVEIAQTSQRYDREKAETYARAGVPEYWLVDLEARRVEVRRDPTPDGIYARFELLGEEEDLAVLDTGRVWRVAQLLP